MAPTIFPLLFTTEGPSSENSSFFYDYEYYLDDVAFMLCRKDEVLSFSKVFLPVFYSLIFVLGLSGNLLLLIVLLRMEQAASREMKRPVKDVGEEEQRETSGVPYRGDAPGDEGDCHSTSYPPAPNIPHPGPTTT